VFDKALKEVTAYPVSYENSASFCCFRLLDCATFLDENRLRIIEFPVFSPADISYAAISYPWHDLQLAEGHIPPGGSFGVVGAEHADAISIDVLRTACMAARHFGATRLWLDRLCILQRNKEDKNWQIQHMFKIYQHSDPCLILPGGLVRLASLVEPTTWIDRAWTLQEAAANLKRDSVKCVFSFTHTSAPEFAQEFHKLGYPHDFVHHLATSKRIIQYIIEPLHSAACDLLELAAGIGFATESLEMSSQGHTMEFPIHIISNPALKMLSRGMVHNRLINYQLLWMSAFVRSSSRPVDMIFSLMGLMGSSYPSRNLDRTIARKR
jgi:hypothetical protein